jgi:hypothetical protein
MTTLSDWQNFYVIVGSSAGALIGLQFVVMALISQIPNLRRTAETGRTFATPNIVHFVAALLLAAWMCAPWQGISTIVVLWGIGGLVGVIYSGVTTRRLRKQTGYTPEFEDWLFHAILPLVAYGALLYSACCGFFDLRASSFGVAAAAMLLLLVGIHNAWDTVTYHIFVRKPEAREP